MYHRHSFIHTGMIVTAFAAGKLEGKPPMMALYMCCLNSVDPSTCVIDCKLPV